MRIESMVLVIFLIGIESVPAAGADTVRRSSGRIGCPQCKNDGSAIAQLLKRSDLLYAKFKPVEAAAELLKVLQLDAQNHEALAKLSRAHIDIGDMIPESAPDWQEKRKKEYSVAEEYARKAVKADPNSTWGHFYVAASLGKIAMLSPIPRQVDLAEEIRGAVEQSIALDPQNGYAYHIYGVWHRKMAEIGQMSRMVASVVLWRSLPHGSMEASVDYLKKAIALNPTVILSRLELARTYVAIEQWALARNYLTSIKNLSVQFSDDSKHKKNAAQLLEEIKGR